MQTFCMYFQRKEKACACVSEIFKYWTFFWEHRHFWRRRAWSDYTEWIVSNRLINPPRTLVVKHQHQHPLRREDVGYVDDLMTSVFSTFSGVYFQGTTIGMAPIMSMCTAEQSGGIVMVRKLTAYKHAHIPLIHPEAKKYENNIG